MNKSFTELMKLNTFEERFKYLVLHGIVGDETFGGHRYLNQILYKSPEYRSVRNQVIIRDNGCDLGISDRPIYGSIFVHHINPITIDDVLNRRECLFDLNNLICVSFKTHNAIHYGDLSILESEYVERFENDTIPWKK